MRDAPGLQLALRQADLARRERAASLANKRAILENTHALEGTGKSTTLLAALQQLFQEDLDQHARELLAAFHRFLPPPNAVDAAALAGICREQLTPVAEELSAEIEQAAHAIGLAAIGGQFRLDEALELVLERADLEIAAWTNAPTTPPPTSRQDAEEATPRVFLSYSWDDQAHKAWVKELATRLRQDGIKAILDRWETRPGDRLAHFMERAVRENDVALIICTPGYKRRSDDRCGGVGYEVNIMSAAVGADERRFVPVLRGPDPSTAIPTWLAGKYYIDLRGNPYPASSYAELRDTLLGRVEGPPPLESPRAQAIIEDSRIQPVWKSSSFLANGEVLATTDDLERRDIVWQNGPQAFLRVVPRHAGRPWTPKELRGLVSHSTAPLLPPGCESGSLWQLRHSRGAVVCYADAGAAAGTTDRFSQVFRSGELWGIAALPLHEDGSGQRYVSANATENLFLTTLDTYLRFMRTSLQMHPPLEIHCGLSGIEGVGIIERRTGYAVEEEVIHTHVLERYDDPRDEILKPFFRMIWDACGLDYE